MKARKSRLLKIVLAVFCLPNTLSCCLLGQNLRRAGDEVLSIEGVLSAFLSFVFNRVSPGPRSKREPVKFSAACWEAAEKGKRRDDTFSFDVCILTTAVFMFCRRLFLAFALFFPRVSLVASLPRDP